jgi:TetR/AcrR family transcriptional regulator, transcriptional repressor for nem operon
MPRERHFSEPEVLDRLTDAFSTHGYGGTSMTVLQAATGLGKQSLYNTFGDKQAMYLQAIDCAVRRYAQGMAAMQAAPTGRVALDVFFDHLTGQCAASDPASQHCIVTNGLLEGVADAKLQWALQSRWLATHEVLRAAVERGQRDGSVLNPAPSTELAELLMAITGGLRVAARAGRSAAQMQSSVALALEVLDRA